MLETKRCTMKTFQKSDYDDVKKLYTNPDVRKFLGGVRQKDSIEAALDDMLRKNDDCFYWAVRKKHPGDFMGLISLDPHHDGLHLEISYQFLPQWWGKGYATEAVQLIINYGLNELKLSKIVAETQTANIPSCKLLERVGMELEQTTSRFGAEQAIYSIKSS